MCVDSICRRVESLARGISPGTMCLVAEGGSLWCWGSDDDGELTGNFPDGGGNPGVFLPTRIPGFSDVTRATVGDNLVCALRATGTVSCWGRNDFGQVGRDLDPMTVPRDPTADPNEVVVVDSNGSPLTNVRDVLAGKDHVCAIAAGGAVYCWGQNLEGQLGSGASANRPYATPVLTGFGAAPLTGAVGLGLSNANTCALLANGRVRCWGKARLSGTGNASTTAKLYYAAPDQELAGLDNVVRIDAGELHMCATHLVCSGSGVEKHVSCWGNNERGQLTVAPMLDQLSPVALPLTGVSSMPGGWRFACVLNGGQVGCAGENGHGQLGNGDTIDSPVFTAVPIAQPVELVTAWWTACARLANGGLSCWGWNNRGQLGTNNTGLMESADPVDVRFY